MDAFHGVFECENAICPTGILSWSFVRHEKQDAQVVIARRYRQGPDIQPLHCLPQSHLHRQQCDVHDCAQEHHPELLQSRGPTNG